MEENKIEVRTVRYFKDETVRPKNAYAIGTIGREIYVALLFREEVEGREIFSKKIHTLKTDTQDRVDIPQEEVEDVFRKILFY